MKRNERCNEDSRALRLRFNSPQCDVMAPWEIALRVIGVGEIGHLLKLLELARLRGGRGRGLFEHWLPYGIRTRPHAYIRITLLLYVRFNVPSAGTASHLTTSSPNLDFSPPFAPEM